MSEGNDFPERRGIHKPELFCDVRPSLDCHPEMPDVVPLNQLGVKHVARLRALPEQELNKANYKEEIPGLVKFYLLPVVVGGLNGSLRDLDLVF